MTKKNKPQRYWISERYLYSLGACSFGVRDVRLALGQGPRRLTLKNLLTLAKAEQPPAFLYYKWFEPRFDKGFLDLADDFRMDQGMDYLEAEAHAAWHYINPYGEYAS